MGISRLVPLALRSILRNSGRSLLTILGVVIGVTSVVIMVGIGLGAQAAVQERIASLGTNMIVVTPGSSNSGGVRGGAGSLDRLSVDDADAMLQECQLLSAVSPVIDAPAQLVGGEGNWRAPVSGVSVSYQEIRAWPVREGRFFDDSEVRSLKRVCVLGETVAEVLFPDADPVGELVRIRNVPFEVVGVLEAKGQTAEGTDQDDVVLAPYTTVKTRLAGRQFIPQILASTWVEEDMPYAIEEVQAVLRETHGLADWQEDDFVVRDQSELAETAQSTTEVMTWLLSAIASISLLVGGIGIMNIMLVSVTERTREIGIRLAVGARKNDVLSQFLVEAVVLSGLGGAIGVVLGGVGVLIVGQVTGWATAISPSTVLLALMFSMIIGVFFGWVPARRAAALDPIEALRHQ